MKTLISAITILFFSAPQVFAHEGEEEITNLAEADWIGPIIAIIVIVGAMIMARVIRKRPARQRPEPKAMAGGSNTSKQIIINN